MNKFAAVFGSVLFLISIISFTLAAESVTYDFDEVNVLYAAQFDILEVDGEEFGLPPTPDSFVNDLVGEDGKLTVTYGVIELLKEDEVMLTEEFIKVEGEKGSRRFLLDSASYDYYAGTTQPSMIFSFFWSAKKLEGTAIVKNFEPPVYSVTLLRGFDSQGTIDGNSFSLFFSDDGENAPETLGADVGQFPTYYSNPETFQQTGDPTASVVSAKGIGQIGEDSSDEESEETENSTKDGNKTGGL